MAKVTNSNSKFTEDWLPLKSIENGMIVTDDGSYVTGVKIFPQNIFIMEAGRQNQILSALANFYNTIDYEFWLLITDRPVDIDIYMSKLLQQYNQSDNKAVRNLIMQDINKANMFVSPDYNVVDTEYYLLFKSKKMDEIQKRIRNLITYLSSTGLVAAQTSNADLRLILDGYLNDGEVVNVKAVL